MDVVEILSAPLPRCTRHIPVDTYLLSASHGTTRARSATTRRRAQATATKTLQDKISPRIVRAARPASKCDLDHLVVSRPTASFSDIHEYHRRGSCKIAS